MYRIIILIQTVKLKAVLKSLLVENCRYCQNKWDFSFNIFLSGANRLQSVALIHEVFFKAFKQRKPLNKTKIEFSIVREFIICSSFVITKPQCLGNAFKSTHQQWQSHIFDAMTLQKPLSTVYLSYHNNGGTPHTSIVLSSILTGDTLSLRFPIRLSERIVQNHRTRAKENHMKFNSTLALTWLEVYAGRQWEFN